jgi:hypothetical protein
VAGCFWLLALTLIPLLSAQQVPSKVDQRHAEDYQRYVFLQQAMYLCRWPDKAFQATDNQSVIAILGKESNPELLEKLTMRRKTVDGRQIIIKRFDDPEKVTACHILFVTADIKPDMQRKTIKLFRGKPVLLVGETSDFTGLGGCISLLAKSGMIEREFNTAAISAQTVVVDLRLQKGGRFVETTPEPAPAPNSQPDENNDENL